LQAGTLGGEDIIRTPLAKRRKVRRKSTGDGRVTPGEIKTRKKIQKKTWWTS